MVVCMGDRVTEEGSFGGQADGVVSKEARADERQDGSETGSRRGRGRSLMLPNGCSNQVDDAQSEYLSPGRQCSAVPRRRRTSERMFISLHVFFFFF